MHPIGGPYPPLEPGAAPEEGSEELEGYPGVDESETEGETPEPLELGGPGDGRSAGARSRGYATAALVGVGAVLATAVVYAYLVGALAAQWPLLLLLLVSAGLLVVGIGSFIRAQKS